MINYIQPGETLQVTAPEALAAGELFFIGDEAFVACEAADSAALVMARRTGVYELPKTAGASTGFAAGARAIYDVSADAFDATAADSADRIAGIVVEAAGDSATTVKVLINAKSTRMVGGLYTQTADDATANLATIPTGLTTILGFSVVLASSANALNGADAVVNKSSGNITVANGGATYVVTNGHKVHWTAVGY